MLCSTECPRQSPMPQLTELPPPKPCAQTTGVPPHTPSTHQLHPQGSPSWAGEHLHVHVFFFIPQAAGTGAPLGMSLCGYLQLASPQQEPVPGAIGMGTILGSDGIEEQAQGCTWPSIAILKAKTSSTKPQLRFHRDTPGKP